MPFRKWAVEPVFLYKKPLPPDKNTSELYSVTNVQLVNCLRQLSSVAKIANQIFDEIGTECRVITERAQRLKSKIGVVRDVVEKLNARAVKVPVSDISQTVRQLRQQQPYETNYDKDVQLFLPSTRPPCIDRLYSCAETNPVEVICTTDRYRTDGLSGSDFYMVTPVLGGEKRKKQKKYLDIETRKPANFTLDKAKQDLVKFGTSSLPPVVSPSRGYILKQNENLELERLPSPEEQAMLTALEYPSTIVPVDTSGTGFHKMSLLRRSLIHVDFIIKKRKSKKKSKRRHTFCEGQNREIEEAMRNVTNSSCQTDDLLDTTVSSSNSLNRTLCKRRSRSTLDNSRRKTMLDELDSDLQQDSKDSATEDDKEKTPSKSNTIAPKKSKTSSLRSRSFNPISSLSAAISIAAVKMRNTARGVGSKQDDGRSSSGNWSASSSTRASVDSDHQHAVSPVDGVSSPSRNSVGKDSVLSDATQFDPQNRSRDEILLIQSLSSSPIKRKKFGPLNLPWEPNGSNRTSNTPTPDFTSHCSSITPVIRSPYAGRRGVSDDGDSSVYSVDTDGYYTSMHTDSGLWCNAVTNLNGIPEVTGFRQRKESQSSQSTNDNSSINSFLSKSATEYSSNSGSIKGQKGPDPPPRVSSCNNTIKRNQAVVVSKQNVESSDKSESPQPQNGSTSESEEHEVKERIRVKTAITANRYPSLCAVSPETSDDEVSVAKNKAAQNVNVIVAEVHREEKSDVQKVEIPDTPKKFINCSPIGKVSVNMYRSETPLPSNFDSSFMQNSQPVATSSPRSGVSISTFSPDLNESRSINGSSTSSKVQDIDSCFDSDDEITVTGSPITPHKSSDKSLIPLKYAQRITVTPIARSESSSSVTGTIKRTPIKSYNSPTSTLKYEKSFTIPFNKDNHPSYISFQSPDSPISSTSSFSKLLSTEKISASPTGSLPRPVARVTLDPSGKVVYSSNSLGRISSSNSSKDCVEKKYSTLPSHQTHIDGRFVTQHLNKNPVNFSPILLSDETKPTTTEHPNMFTIPHMHPNKNSIEKNFEVSLSNQSKITPPRQIESTEVDSKLTNDKENKNINQSTSKTDVVTQLSSSTPLSRAFNVTQPALLRTSQDNTSSIPLRLNESKQHPNSTPQSPYENTSPVSNATAKREFNFRPSRGGRICRSYFPSHLISPPSAMKENQLGKANYFTPVSSSVKSYSNSPVSNSPNQQNYSSYSSRAPEPVTPRNVTSCYSSNVPNTQSDISTYRQNTALVSNVWPGRPYNSQSKASTAGTKLQPPNKPSSICTEVSSKKNAQPRSSFMSLRPPDLIPSGESPPSTLDITSPAGGQRLNQRNSSSEAKTSPNDQKNLKSMSAAELFAIIHSSKKKHNIKSESELSMSPLSSRSVSPALSQSSLSKLQPVETGVLSKRSDISSPDKSKWCNSMPSTFRKSAHDKLPPTKPTSMHDFKMLLLQTRTGVNDSSPRPSAAELLKISPTRSSTPVPQSPSSKLPSPSSFKSPISHYSSNPSYSPSHGTVPMKRNMRTRSPYLTRYDSAYPPIMEDCSEEVENIESSKCLNSINPSYTQLYKLSDSVQRPTPVVAKATSTWV